METKMKVGESRGLMSGFLFLELCKNYKISLLARLSAIPVYLRVDDKSVRFDQIIKDLKSCINDTASETMLRQQLVEYCRNESLSSFECRSLIGVFEIDLNNNTSQIEAVIGRKLSVEEKEEFYDAIFFCHYGE